MGNKSDLKKTIVKVEKINWISDKIIDNISCEAKIKSDQASTPGKLKLLKNNCAEFEFDKPQISIAPGQACVFYLSDEVLGGGWISNKN